MNQSPRSVIGLLTVFSVLYLLPLIWSPGLGHVALCVGLFFAVMGSSAVLLARLGVRGRAPTKQGLAFVGLTSGLEFLAVAAGLIAGFVWDAWWLLGALLLSSVLLHFLAMTYAFRRPIDFLLLPVICASAGIAWLADREDPLTAWGYAGGLAAGACTSYALALMWGARRNNRAGSNHADPGAGAFS